MIEDYIHNNYGDYIDQLYIYENKDSLKLSAIVLKKDKRETGIGTRIMTDIINYADKTNKLIVLTPSSDYGGTKQRLINFYRSFGFVWNRGPHKDFRFMDSMIRYPKTMKETHTKLKESFEGYSNDALTDMIVNLSRYEGNEEDIQRVKQELKKRKGITEDKVKGGLADNKSVKDIADKHNTTVDAIKKQIKKGEKVEKEHTSDEDLAREIAKDHEWEDDKYYDNPLFKKDLEESTKKFIKKLLREHIDLTVTDETPESITVLVEYNTRNAGIITVASGQKNDNIIEIVAIKFKEEYHTLFIINEAVKSLWQLFKNANEIIVAPKKESIEFWNKLGFNRISPNYLLLKRAP